MTNKASTVLYTGVTGELKRRTYEHRRGLIDGFTKRYKIREKQIKAGSRAKKMDLIDGMNPTWRDLYGDI